MIEKIRQVQEAVSLEYLVIHVFYGAMPREKAEKSLRLFANEVLPAIHDIATPIHASSHGVPAETTAS